MTDYTYMFVHVYEAESTSSYIIALLLYPLFTVALPVSKAPIRNLYRLKLNIYNS